MKAKLFHIFRNNPLGRETLLQSIYFCKTVGVYLIIYIPNDTKFWLYVGDNAVQVDLDKSYLGSPKTAIEHATEVVEENGIMAKFIDSEHSLDLISPNIHTNFDFMTCPRSISDLSSKIGLGHLGPKVRRIIESAQFPILITSPAYKQWNSIAVFFGGSANGVIALKLGLRIGRASGMPLDVFTQVEKVPIEFYEKAIEDNNLKKEMNRRLNKWHIFEQGSFEENLYNVLHDALVVMGAYGHSPIKEIVFGSKMEKVQSILPNNLLIAGPMYREPNTSIPSWFPSL